MSVHNDRKRPTLRRLKARKGGEPIASLTAYTTPIAKILAPEVDFLLVGDSLGMVLYGMDSTLGVTLEMMIAHGRAVVKGAAGACPVIVDMPFGSYEESPEQAFRNAARVMAETGANGVKLEGGVTQAETVQFLTRRGIPVLGHVGLLPQSYNLSGGFRAHGRDASEAASIIADSQAVAMAGAWAIVLEGTIEPVAQQVTENTQVPVIGIGASPRCDGQILVIDDVIGLFTDFQPKFTKRYAQMAEQVAQAAADYVSEVRQRRFPGPEHCFLGE